MNPETNLDQRPRRLWYLSGDLGAWRRPTSCIVSAEPFRSLHPYVLARRQQRQWPSRSQDVYLGQKIMDDDERAVRAYDFFQQHHNYWVGEFRDSVLSKGGRRRNWTSSSQALPICRLTGRSGGRTRRRCLLSRHGSATSTISAILGSGLIDQSQKITVAARAMAERKTIGHLS